MATRMAAKAVAQQPRSVDPAVEQQLRALGYVASTVTRAAMEDKPRGDPKDKIGLYNLLKRAAQDSVDGKLDDGIVKVREVLAADPEVIEAFTMLGNMHTKAGRPNEAIEAYKRALAVDPEHEGAAWSLALAYRDAGKDEEARAGFERVFQLNPRGAKSLYQLADISMREGEFAEAAKLLEQGLGLDADRAAFLVKLGEVRLELKQLDAAEAALTEAVTEKSDQAMAHFNLGLVHEARGNAQAAIAAYEAEIKVSPKPTSRTSTWRGSCRGRPASGRHHALQGSGGEEARLAPATCTGPKALLDAGRPERREQAATRLASSPDPAMAPSATTCWPTSTRLSAATQMPGDTWPKGRASSEKRQVEGRRQKAEADGQPSLGPRAARCAGSSPASRRADQHLPRLRHQQCRGTLVIVTIDTRRADRVGVYGNTTVATPNLDGLARDGAMARHAAVHVPLTRPSHISLFTGLYPAEHGIRDNVSPPLGNGVPVLAEILEKQGFKTAAFVSSIVLSKQSGLGRGFAHYSDHFDIGKDDARFLNTIQKRGDETVGEAVRWLGEAGTERRFAWVHLYDPHDPYEPPEPYASKYAGREYDGEVAWSDELVGRLDAALAAKLRTNAARRHLGPRRGVGTR
jgi:tetratricopeptide (TPR) repeat protein